jgi:hypothetical protein
MNVLLILVLSLVAFGLASTFYARYIGRVLSPATTFPRPRTFSRTESITPDRLRPCSFSHHYATIAGAADRRPTIAAIYGLWPALLWVVLGAVFFGAVHDYTTMFISLREKGRTIAEITHNLTGRWGFILYIAFTLVMIIIVTAAFLDLSVQALTSVVSATAVQLPASNPFGWQLALAPDGGQLVRIGGVATMSVIIITACAPLIGLLIYKAHLNVRWATILAILVAGGSVAIGLYNPVSFGGLEADQIRYVWMGILAVLPAGQRAAGFGWSCSRDFTNSFHPVRRDGPAAGCHGGGRPAGSQHRSAAGRERRGRHGPPGLYLARAHHYDRLRRDQRLSQPGRQRHEQQAVQPRERRQAYRLRRDADGRPAGRAGAVCDRRRAGLSAADAGPVARDWRRQPCKPLRWAWDCHERRWASVYMGTIFGLLMVEAFWSPPIPPSRLEPATCSGALELYLWARTRAETNAQLLLQLWLKRDRDAGAGAA